MKKSFSISTDFTKQAAINAINELDISTPHNVKIEPLRRNRTAAQNNGQEWSTNMKSNYALLRAELLIYCPDCDTDPIDLLDPDFDEEGRVFSAIFKDSFVSLVGMEITCNCCGNVFTLSEIEW